jgi:hypothetical protein
MATIFRNGNLFCDHCGSSEEIDLPIKITDMNKKADAFAKFHKDCRKTWIQPVVDQSLSVQEKANWWIVNGEQGNSSKTMFAYFSGLTGYAIYHPYDPDDFDRCHMLLEAVPEWRKDIKRLGVLSSEWKNLVENWDELTRMYLKNKETNWEQSKEIGMYELMQKCIEIDKE